MACAADPGSTFSDSTETAVSIEAGSFGGTCVPSVSASATAGIGTRAYGTPCGTTQAHGGRGIGLSVRALGVAAARLGDSGELPANGGKVEGAVLSADVASLVKVGVLRGSARSTDGGNSLADASVASAKIGLLGVGITTGVLQSNAKASCGDTSGASLVADLKINGLAVNVTGAPNQTISVGPVRVVINEQVEVNGAIVVHALHVSAAGVADIAIASSRASVDCGCGTGSSSGGSSGGGSSSGGSSGGTAPFGSFGDACDDANTCASGHRCEPENMPLVK